MPTANPDDNKEARANNVASPHPFRQRDIKAGETIYGSHPARQASVAGSSDSAAYNAMQEFKNAQTNFGATAPDGTNYVNPNTKPSQPIGLPQSHVQTFGSGSYESPTTTTNPNANDNTSSINTYSFLDDAQRVADWKERNPDRNVFGFYKRNATSLQNRIDQAKADGKLAKQARLEKKLTNFENNQEARSGIDADTGKKIPGADPTFLDKVNPKNWL